MIEGAIEVSVSLPTEGDSERELTVNVLLDGFVRKHGAAIDIYLVANGNIIAEHRDVFQTCPFAHGAVPPDYGRFDPGVILDTTILEQYATLKTDTITNDHIGSNCDVGTNATVLANLCGRVDQDVAAIDKRF